MSTSSGFQLSNRLVNSMLALLIWTSLSAGVHALVTDSVVLGLMEIGLAVAIALLWKFGDIVDRAQRRHNPAVGLLLGFFAFVMIMFAAFRLTDLAARSLLILGELKISEAIRGVSSLGFLVFLAFFLYQLIFAYRNRSQNRG